MSPRLKLFIVSLALLVFGGIYFFTQTQAGTTIATTIITNPTLEDGLVGHWTFDGPDVDWSDTGAEIKDRSGNGNHGDATTTMTAATSPTAGVLGQGMAFDGGSDTVTIPLDLSATDKLTLSFWFKPDRWLEDGIVYLSDTFDLYFPISVIPYSAAGACDVGYVFVAGRSNEGNNFHCYFQTTALNDWHHYTVVFDVAEPAADELTGLYLDGVLQTPAFAIEIADNVDMFGDTIELRIADTLSGSLDDVRIYNRALSAEEVKRLYELGATTKIAQTLTTNPDLESGLVGHWTMDGQDVDWSSAAAEIKDTSGNAVHLNMENGSPLQNVTSGVLGQALQLSGGPDYARTLNNEPFNNDELTVALWARFDSIGTQQILFTAGTSYVLQLVNTNVLRFDVVSDTIGWNTVAGPTLTQANIGQWVHIVGTYDGTSKLTLYVDGTLYSTDPHEGTVLDIAGGVNLGKASADTSYLDGSLDDVRIYNRALSPAEVKRLYQLGATTKIATTITTNPTLQTGLVGHWTFDGPDVDWASGTAEIKDRSGNNNHGDAEGGMTTRSVTPGPLGQGMAFDGVDDTVEPPFQDSWEGALTWSFWLKTADYNGAIFSRGAYALCRFGLSTHRISCTVESDSAPVISDTYLDDNEWHHVVYVVSGSNQQLFIDGISEDTSSETPNLSNDWTTIGNGEYEGLLDDVRSYNRALTRQEVQRLYELGR